MIRIFGVVCWLTVVLGNGHNPQPEHHTYLPTIPTATPPPSRPGPTPPSQHDHHHHHEPGMPFDFEYSVKADEFGNDYSHNAISDGEQTKGEYKVQMPDGRTQVVRYTADWATGFHAQVSYQGEPRYKASPSAPVTNQITQQYVPEGGYRY